MKRIITFLITCFISLGLFAAYQHEISKPIQLQAGYDAVAFIEVEEVSSQSQAYIQGMPFNIEESYVQYGATEDGRLIAHWSMISNSQVKIRITAEPMHHETKSSLMLPYKLLFTYSIGYTDDDGNNQVVRGEEFEAYSLSAPVNEETGYYGNVTEFNPTPNIIFGDSTDTYVGNLDGSIYFQFTEDASALINSEQNYNHDTANIPVGNYVATVKVELIGV